MSVKGWKELDRFLQEFAPKVERNILRGAMRAGMKVVQPVAQGNVHSVSGLLASGLKIGTRARGGRVTANLKATGLHGPIAHLVEFGTRPHTITAAGKKALSFGGMFYQDVEHPGARPKPFMRPALDGQAQAATIAAGEYIKLRLATKHGLDTSHIQLEGDE